MKRILHVQKVTGVAGSERHLLDLLPSLDRSKYDVTFLGLVQPGHTVQGYFDVLEREGVRTKQITIRTHVDPRCLIDIMDLIRCEAYDLVHTHLVHADFHGLLASKAVGVSYLVSSRHNDDPFRRLRIFKIVFGSLYRSCNHIVAISDWLSRFCKEQERIPRHKITRIHYGLAPICTNTVDPEEIYSIVNLPESTKLLVSVGRLVKQKGHRFLIQATARLICEGHDVGLIIVGEGPLRGILEERAIRLGIGERVIFVGWRHDVTRFLHAADLIIHPSLWEGFGLVLLEAMACQKVIVASAVSAIPEIVLDGETGFLVPPGDSESLSFAIARILQDDAACKRMGKAGRQRLEDHFSVDQMVRATERVYDHVFVTSGNH